MKEIRKSSGRVLDQRVFVITGSGISAESGIPTFRGKDGYWRNLDPTELATPEAFEKNPKLVWEWYCERRNRIRSSQPNAAHRAIVNLALHSKEFLLVTQNVDDLHARAEWEGKRLAPDQIVQIHGDIFVTRCSRCDSQSRDAEIDDVDPPKCPQCGALMRPGVIWFGEELDPHEEQRVNAFLNRGPCDIVIVVGTTATFDYIVDWALRAKGESGELIEVNPEPTPLSRFATRCVREAAAAALPTLVDALLD